MRVLVLHTLPPATIPNGRLPGEFDLQAAADNVAGSLPNAVVAGVRGEPAEILATLALHQPDVVFNLCEAPLGRPAFEAHPATLFEWLDLRFTGCGSETLALCRRKDRTKSVLMAAGVPVPPADGFPCIVKPADQDGSTGIDAASVCADAAARTRALARLAGPAVVEAFLPGREFAVALWGQHEPEHVSLGEMRFHHGLRLNTYASKWDPACEDYANATVHYDADLTAPLRAAVVATARRAWQAVNARGYLRVDLRLDAAGTPCVLEVNPNPEIGPDAGICRAVQEAGWPWDRFVRCQVAWA